jgi:hypothetical protein
MLLIVFSAEVVSTSSSMSNTPQPSCFPLERLFLNEQSAVGLAVAMLVLLLHPINGQQHRQRLFSDDLEDMQQEKLLIRRLMDFLLSLHKPPDGNSDETAHNQISRSLDSLLTEILSPITASNVVDTLMTPSVETSTTNLQCIVHWLRDCDFELLQILFRPFTHDLIPNEFEIANTVQDICLFSNSIQALQQDVQLYNKYNRTLFASSLVTVMNKRMKQQKTRAKQMQLNEFERTMRNEEGNGCFSTFHYVCNCLKLLLLLI